MTTKTKTQIISAIETALKEYLGALTPSELWNLTLYGNTGVRIQPEQIDIVETSGSAYHKHREDDVTAYLGMGGLRFAEDRQEWLEYMFSGTAIVVPVQPQSSNDDDADPDDLWLDGMEAWFVGDPAIAESARAILFAEAVNQSAIEIAVDTWLQQEDERESAK